MKKKPIAHENDLTLRLDEAMIDHLFTRWHREFMSNPIPSSPPPSFITFVEGQIHADQSYRITGKDFLTLIKRIGGKDEKAAEEEK